MSAAEDAAEVPAGARSGAAPQNARATVAAVIPSWNTASYLERCVSSLRAQEGVSIETLVVDNGSQDESVALARRLGAELLALERNIGFAAAVNLGAARTDAPFLLVLNADCFLARGCLAELLAAIDAGADLGGVQPRILQEEPGAAVARVFSAGQCLARSGTAFERGWGHADGAAYADRREIFGVSGAACLLRRELFSELGGYDERLFAFYEDVDLNARARLAGWRFEYVPQAVAHHVGHAGWQRAPSARAFNVSLTVRNRLATAVKVLPAAGVAGAVLATLRSLAASPMHRTTRAAFAGAAGALRWLPGLLAERRRLRTGPTDRLDGWLSRERGAGPDPTRT
jgi:N-acetylglucosaminyl-diphospho-decaprenol L-rhamnosyltransferase